MLLEKGESPMKYWSMMLIFVFTFTFSGIAFGNQQKEVEMDNAYVVVVMLEAKAGKEEDLKQALVKVAQESRKETSCIDYRLHQDQNNSAKFVLYEKWQSADLHQKQFAKPYIEEFANLAEELLAKPYEGLAGCEIR